MRAISGLWHRGGRPDLVQDSARMQRSLAIYGGDRSGLWNNGEIALGVDLSFLTPEDRLDHQPLCGRDGRYVLLADIRLGIPGTVYSMTASFICCPQNSCPCCPQNSCPEFPGG